MKNLKFYWSRKSQNQPAILENQKLNYYYILVVQDQFAFWLSWLRIGLRISKNDQPEVVKVFDLLKKLENADSIKFLFIFQLTASLPTSDLEM